MAPEVRAGSEASGRVATTATDVYMLGGLAYELLTAGPPPFHWLLGNTQLLVQRLASADPDEIPSTDVMLPGLLHKSVQEAAELDRKPIPWCVRADATAGSAGRLEEVKELMASCLALRPEDQPRVQDLHRCMAALQAAEARATGSTGHGRPAAAAPQAESPGRRCTRPSIVRLDVQSAYLLVAERLLLSLGAALWWDPLQSWLLVVQQERTASMLLAPSLRTQVGLCVGRCCRSRVLFFLWTTPGRCSCACVCACECTGPTVTELVLLAALQAEGLSDALQDAVAGAVGDAAVVRCAAAASRYFML
jgi:hypothetical protein